MHAHKLGQMAILSGSYHAIITAYHLVLKFNLSLSTTGLHLTSPGP